MNSFYRTLEKLVLGDITRTIFILRVIFNGNSSEYIIDITDIEISVTDKVSDRDGINILKEIEKIKFTDQTIELN